MSYADTLKIGLGIMEPKVQEKKSIQKAAYGKGYEKGYEHGSFDAEMTYSVTFPCSGCGEIIEVDDEQSREAAGKYMEEKGWGHLECINQD